MRRTYKGSVPSGQRAQAAQSVDLLIFGDGTGASQMKEVRAGNSANELGIYVKCGGVRTTDAEWNAAQPYLWKQSNGQPYTQGQFGWAYADLQRYAEEWARAVVIPHVEAQLALLPAGTIQWVMVDNCIYQHPSLFVPVVPPDYDVRTYHDATLHGLLVLRSWLDAPAQVNRFGRMKLLPNGWQGSAPVGFRGEALGSKDMNYCDGVWFEGMRFKTSGEMQSDARFIQDQGAFMSLLRAGKVCVWDEPGASVVSYGKRQSLGLFAATTAVAVNGDNGYFNESSPKWVDWWRWL